MLPGLDGFEVLRRFRSTVSVSVLLLTARGEDVDRIVGLGDWRRRLLFEAIQSARTAGKDARYSAQERGTQRRRQEHALSASSMGLELIPAARIAHCNGKMLELTDVEFALLEALMRSAGKVVSREEISENVLGRKFHPFDRSLDMHVSRLRRKLAGSDFGR